MRQGARIADLGCGQGASTLLLAAAYPNCAVVGIDPHPGSLDAARTQAAEQGVGDRVSLNLTAVGAAYYAFSTTLCTPN